MIALPPRYEAKWLLGQGGSGEVWAVRDRANGKMLALKVLAEGAGDGEVMALVREAMALSGLEGLGVPRVIAFGTIAGNTDGPSKAGKNAVVRPRRYMLRELVEGHSLEDVLDDVALGDWVAPLARASEQLTVLHRAGLLHGDVKPANVIVGADGAATLVDLGLAAPWREGGSRPKGLTPKYAAPELFQGAKLTVRAEVYALGATLADALERRGDALPKKTRLAFHEIAERATAEEPTERHPSVDEFASELRHAAGLDSRRHFADEAAWPVIGLEKTADQLRKALAALGPGEGLAIEGAPRSGRTTLARRLAWSLGVEGQKIVFIEPLLAGSVLTTREVLEMDLPSPAPDGLVVIIDDADRLDDASRVAITHASEQGARLVFVASRSSASRLCSGKCVSFAIPPIDTAAAEDLVHRAMPSLPTSLVAHLVAEANGRPGKLRTIVKLLAGRAIVAREDIDQVLSSREASVPPGPATTPDDALAAAEKALDMGRIADAQVVLDMMAPPATADERVRTAIARARMALGVGDSREAKVQLESAAKEAAGSPNERSWQLTMARTHLRHGDYAGASQFATRVASSGNDALTADALSVHGIALAWTGREAEAESTLARALAIALRAQDRRVEAVARGAVAIVHQRAGKNAEAREAYEASLAAAEDARDATTVALTRLNLGGLARAEGDLALALVHLEAAVDMGRRAGSLLAVQGALLHLANLDLYLGRYARARASVDSLAEGRRDLSPIQSASLLGLEAELAARAGDTTRGAELYEASALVWDAQGRLLDAAEARLERILVLSREHGAAAGALAKDLSDVEAHVQGTLGEHEALAELVRGAIAVVEGNENVARTALDKALNRAEKAGRREWSWLTLETRARLLAAQGSSALARRDVEAALAILEETASKLPRDLREVFWNDPRRRALRQAHVATHAFVSTAHTVPGSAARIAPSIRGKTTTIGAPMPAEDRLIRIFEITRELASERDLDRLLTRVTDHAIALTAAERGFVLLAKSDGKLHAHAARDRSGELASEAHAQFSHSVAAKVVQTGEPVITESARTDDRLAKAASVHQLMIQAIACVPIRSADPVAPVIGALYVETRGGGGVRFSDEISTLSAFADQAAIAIESARLIDENRSRAEELAVANVELEAARDKLAEALGRRTEQLATVRRDLKQVRAELRSHFGYAGLVGTSAPMRKLYAVIERIKDTDVPVLITGESGVGKEVVAKAVHASGPRAKKAFLGVNCGAIPENLLESELFGNVRGAFTGAERDRNGLFREADGGTLLLDEVGELPLKMQAALLRVLQEKCVRPVGAAKEEPVDVRVVAATNRDLQKMVEEGTFREDLFYRLHVIELPVPPLRARLDDLPPLIDHFMGLFAARYRRERKSVAREAVRTLTAFEWPGNVRQLEHVLLNAWLMSEGHELTTDDFELPGTVRASSIAPPSPRPIETAAKGSSARSRAEFKDAERERILAALASSNWNRVRAAKMIGLPRRTFYRRLKEFGIV